MTIAILAGLDASLLNFRLEFMLELKTLSARVIALAPAGNGETAEALGRLGIEFFAVPLARTGTNPADDRRYFRAVFEILKRERPDITFAYTIKPIVHGLMAAKAAGTRRLFALVTGLGTAFNSRGVRGIILKGVASLLYWRSLRHCEKIFVQNEETAELFSRWKIAARQRMVLVRGSGVDTRHFAWKPVPERLLVFLFVGRLLRDKGVYEFVSAARTVKKKLSEAEFRIVGDVDANPTSVRRSEIDGWTTEGIVTYAGFQKDVRPHLQDSSVFVLPSYHEGLPRSVLEAMSIGRAIITTDAIGCRETIFEIQRNGKERFQVGINGVLVSPRSAPPLAEAMLFLAGNPELLRKMGQRSRELAVEHFDVQTVNARLIQNMKLGARATNR